MLLMKEAIPGKQPINMPAIALSEQIDMGFIKKDYDVNDAVSLK